MAILTKSQNKTFMPWKLEFYKYRKAHCFYFFLCLRKINIFDHWPWHVCISSKNSAVSCLSALEIIFSTRFIKCRAAQVVPSCQPGCEKMERKCRGNGERMRKWREIHSLHFLIFSLFPPSLTISFIKIVSFCRKNCNYGTFVTNVTKNLTYAL